MIISSAEEGIKKPQADIYQIMLGWLKADVREIIFVDDTWENIETAQKLGIDSIHFQSTDQALAS